jgi:imidazolonepropionase-like amidohydrolase
MVRAGADVIKIASSGGFLSPSDDPMEPNYSQEEVDAIVRTAADLGTWVMSHAHGPEGIKRAIRAGVRSIDHGTYLDEEAAAMMVERGTWLVPTLTAGDTTDELANDPKVQPAVREKLLGLGRPEFDAMRLAAEAGVKVGLARETATLLAAQTMLGAAKVVLETGHHPALLKDMVTTPAGCTIDGILELEEGKLRVTLIKAVVKATQRARELVYGGDVGLPAS